MVLLNLCLLVAAGVLAASVQADYTFTADLASLANFSNTMTLFNGNCCSSNCNSSCNVFFLLCLRRDNFNSAANTCPLGEILAHAPVQSSDLHLSGTFTGAWEVLTVITLFVFHSPLETFGSNVGSTAADGLIDIFISGTVSLLPSSPTMQALFQGISTTLVASFEVTCATNFYGQTCNMECEHRNDSLGHYTCDPVTGDRVCLEGYMGESTDCTQCRPRPGCSSTGGFCRTPGECRCIDGFFGDNCSLNASSSPTNATSLGFLTTSTAEASSMLSNPISTEGLLFMSSTLQVSPPTTVFISVNPSSPTMATFPQPSGSASHPSSQNLSMSSVQLPSAPNSTQAFSLSSQVVIPSSLNLNTSLRIPTAPTSSQTSPLSSEVTASTMQYSSSMSPRISSSTSSTLSESTTPPLTLASSSQNVPTTFVFSSNPSTLTPTSTTQMLVSSQQLPTSFVGGASSFAVTPSAVSSQSSLASPSEALIPMSVSSSSQLLSDSLFSMMPSSHSAISDIEVSFQPPLTSSFLTQQSETSEFILSSQIAQNSSSATSDDSFTMTPEVGAGRDRGNNNQLYYILGGVGGAVFLLVVLAVVISFSVLAARIHKKNVKERKQRQNESRYIDVVANIETVGSVSIPSTPISTIENIYASVIPRAERQSQASLSSALQDGDDRRSTLPKPTFTTFMSDSGIVMLETSEIESSRPLSTTSQPDHDYAVLECEDLTVEGRQQDEEHMVMDLLGTIKRTLSQGTRTIDSVSVSSSDRDLTLSISTDAAEIESLGTVSSRSSLESEAA